MNKPIFYYAVILLVTTALLVQCGLKSITLTVPKSASANAKVSFIVHGGAEPRITNDGTYTTQLLAGMMVPKSWKARTNAVVTFTSPKGNGTLRLIPDSEIEPVSGVNWHQAAKKMFGIGPNLVDDFEWIVYRSVQSYTFVNNEDIDFYVKFELSTGEENMLAILGFYLGSSIENLRPEDVDYKKVAFSKPFEVTDGEGDLIDFVNPKLSAVQPVKSLDTDIISLSFDAGLMSTVLDGEANIYIAAKAFDASNQLIGTIDLKTDHTKLVALGGKKYIIDIWPRRFFKVQGNQSIARLEYYFTDQSGTKQVGYGNSPEPFKYTFICK